MTHWKTLTCVTLLGVAAINLGCESKQPEPRQSPAVTEPRQAAIDSPVQSESAPPTNGESDSLDSSNTSENQSEVVSVDPNWAEFKKRIDNYKQVSNRSETDDN